MCVLMKSSCNPPYEVSCDAESFQYDDNDDTDYQTESAVEDDLTLGVRSVDHFKGSNVNLIGKPPRCILSPRPGTGSFEKTFMAMTLQTGCDNRPPLPFPGEEGGGRGRRVGGYRPTALPPYRSTAFHHSVQIVVQIKIV